LETKDGKQYYTHTRWGRVGEYGQAKTIGPFSLEEALKEFDKKFKDKSGLSWDDRSAEPKPKKYTFIEKSYESDDDDAAEAGDQEDGDQKDEKAKSELPIETQRLMELIFNENHFNSVLEELGYNADKLPLGKLGKSTLKKGFEHLQELASLIKHPSLSQNKYGKSQREVSLPHRFGLWNSQWKERSSWRTPICNRQTNHSCTTTQSASICLFRTLSSLTERTRRQSRTSRTSTTPPSRTFSAGGTHH
jgi:predicted DNA-binding WGR domain protein